MNRLYVYVGIAVIFGALYSVELAQRRKYRALVASGVCARCRTAVSTTTPLPAGSSPSYLGYCPSCFMLRRKRDRLFFLVFGVVVAVILATSFWFRSA